jgi:hypothetical protein
VHEPEQRRLVGLVLATGIDSMAAGLAFIGGAERERGESALARMGAAPMAWPL